MNVFQQNYPAFYRFALPCCLNCTVMIGLELQDGNYGNTITRQIQNHLVLRNVVSITQCLNFESVLWVDSQYWGGFLERDETDIRSQIFDPKSDDFCPKWPITSGNHPTAKGLSRSHCTHFFHIIMVRGSVFVLSSIIKTTLSPSYSSSWRFCFNKQAKILVGLRTTSIRTCWII